MSYAATTGHPYLTSPPYYSPSPHLATLGHVHSLEPPRQDNSQRKRPKYTRSKTGCLTCRVKKIKCDETKPNCQRCTHGQRDCTWPEGVPARKKSTPKKEPIERPSTAGSSGISDGSAPPTRDSTPPKRTGFDVGLPSLAPRRQTASYLQMHTLSSDPEPARRHSCLPLSQGYPSPPPTHTTSSHNLMPMIPDFASYPTHQRYGQSYSSSRTAPSHHHIPNLRPVSHYQQINPWTQPVLDPLDHMNPYFQGLHDRSLLGHTAHHDHQHARYQ